MTSPALTTVPSARTELDTLAPFPILHPSPRITLASSAPFISQPSIARTLSSFDALTEVLWERTVSVSLLPFAEAPWPMYRAPSMAHPGAFQSRSAYSASAMARFALSRSLGLPTSIQIPSTSYPWILRPSDISLGTRSLEKS